MPKKQSVLVQNPVNGTSATTDFSSILKLSLITVPKSYIQQKKNFDVTKLHATFSSFSMPITEDII
jgi:hypothetical protein